MLPRMGSEGPSARTPRVESNEVGSDIESRGGGIVVGAEHVEEEEDKEKKEEETPSGSKLLHDYGNLVIMALMLIMCVDGLIQWPTTMWQPVCLLVYFVVDSAWIFLDPSIVRSPTQILIHHAAASGLVLAALPSEALRPYWSLGVTIEFNTVFLIAQRNVAPGALRTLLRALLLATWLPLRFGVPLLIAWFSWTKLQEGILSPEGAALMFPSILVLLGCQALWTAKLLEAVSVLRGGL